MSCRPDHILIKNSCRSPHAVRALLSYIQVMKKIDQPVSVSQRKMPLRAPLLRAGFCIGLLVFSFGCNNAPTQIVQNSNSASANSAPERAQTAIAHGPQEKMPSNPPSSGSKWTQSGDAFDTSEYDAAVTSAEKAANAKPSDEKLKLALAVAYLKRATALTEKRQYASALGDYRRTLKYDPSNAEAKQWIDQIISIYNSIGRSYPAEGEEPPPLPFKKGGK